MLRVYRLQQFLLLLRPRPLTTAAQKDVQAVLTAAQWALFQTFSPGDQWHSYHVMKTLQAAGYDDAHLLTAALLHDIGKTRLPITIWERSLIVLVERLWPQRLILWGRGDRRWWKRPFILKNQHPAWGAEMAAAAGCSMQTVALIARHQEKSPLDDTDPHTHQLRVLQWADNQH